MSDKNKQKALDKQHPRSHPGDLDQFGRDGQIPLTGQKPNSSMVSMAEAEERAGLRQDECQ
ncbi:hypothetical protein DFP93_10584 [Aneurinibacillus soli]|uniref:Uncharacterized protein n=1 Tax=Aneurinibacillus soli TaxID=1500254 RepID=A0A0U4WJD8_9BACL|nr:hypothetical protein [Aneurinibacillus soli]PYE62131.1 hypothetical protein DFP93_10584 [Aneurinibacillus soli]BAU28681.1 hypothetical protein CB4_02856 [Aneurinibacillus soli]